MYRHTVRRHLSLFIAFIFLTAIVATPTSVRSLAKQGPPEQIATNVIFMIPDGFSADHATNYRWFKGRKAAWDDLLVGMVKTHSADNKITDSAAAGTAMATGVKTNNGMISVDPQGKERQTILEAARSAGKKTGLVVTSNVTNATPAVFASHVTSRHNERAIAPQMLDRVDVLLGGGKQFFLPMAKGGKQQGRDLVVEANRRGFRLIENRAALRLARADKILGLFANAEMAPELDRDETNEPSLQEMTAKAIDILSQNSSGFFLMVEGSQIDRASHAHDAAWAMKDIAAFEQAVQTAVDFARADGHTLVVIAGDHDTGGMSVGGYNKKEANLEVLRHVNASGNAIAAKLNADRSNVAEIVFQHTGITLTAEEGEAIKRAEQPARAINVVISKRAAVSWTSDTHTGTDIPLYAYGPSSHTFAGLRDNTELPRLIAAALQLRFSP
ncbi:alkaline phosphatase [Numidum massiliense]|uniref:alkaline phosphatase n=1 Tax=Numidum massiliense TaxID=1522315 RepID=UPI0006D58525|nr:alkaline phosphatase [Numidum massiliense]